MQAWMEDRMKEWGMWMLMGTGVLESSGVTGMVESSGVQEVCLMTAAQDEQHMMETDLAAPGTGRRKMPADSWLDLQRNVVSVVTEAAASKNGKNKSEPCCKLA